MIGNLLSIKQLEALIWVAELGSFRKAAHHLNTTQPNISARISGLESTLKTVLMERDPGSITLTDKGQEILIIARQLLREAEQIIEIADRSDLIVDRLRLGVTELVACTWLHEYLRQLKSAYPALNIDLTVDLSRNLDSALKTNRLDLAIQSAPFAADISGQIELGETPYIWVAAPYIAAEISSHSSVEDLFQHSVLTHARHTQAFSELEDHAKDNGLSISRFVSSNSLASCVQMAADGMGVCLLPKALVQRELNDERLIEVDVDWLPSQLSFAARYDVTKSSRYLDRSAELAFMASRSFFSQY